MKHMKKRALLSAIAMLVVTAVALSSATYAWFSAGDSVSVAEVSAQVSNSTGAILISANGTTWQTSLTVQDLKDQPTNQMPSSLSPVSVTATDAGVSVIGGEIKDGVFSAKPAAATYIKYTVYLKATVNCTASIAPTFASGAAATFCYGAVSIPGDTLLLNGISARTYYPIANAALSCSDNNPANDIVDGSECSNGDLGAQLTAAVSTGTLSLTMTADQVYTFNVYVWAEGQDQSCRGAIQATNATMSVLVTKL